MAVELAVEGGDLFPVSSVRRTGKTVQMRDGGLDLILTRSFSHQRLFSEVSALMDGVVVPFRTVLVIE